MGIRTRHTGLIWCLVLACTSVLVATGVRGWGFAQPQDTIPEVELGRLLFWDPVLSGELDVACATCHHPDFAYADGRDLALGVRAMGLGPDRVDLSGGEIPVLERNTPTVLNIAFNGVERRRRRGGRRGDEFARLPASVDAETEARAPMFWDRRVRGLEAQALVPLTIREEMRGDAYAEEVAVDSVVARLRAIPEYVAFFREVYGPDTRIEADHVASAIVAFERSLVTRNSPYDRFLAGEEDALTQQQRRGLEEFDNADCTNCHDGPMLSDFDLVAEGVAENPLLAEPDVGDGRFRFRTPTLRNVALTAPYMHNGMLETLEDVLEFYDRGRSENPNVVDRRGRRRGDDADVPGTQIARGRLSGQFRGVDNMSEREMADIVAFLEALTDPDFDRTVPESVPSGLPPGGMIGEPPTGAP